MTPELTAQSLWSLVPVASRARYVRRTAVAMLDELEDLAACWRSRPAGRASDVVLSELLPAARGLHTLADLGPRVLADRRVIPRAAWLAGRSTRIIRSPVGVVGLRGPSASPWCEPALETAASLLAGNAVLVDAGAAGERLRGVFLRAGVPGELVTVAADLDARCRRVIDLPPPNRLGTLLVLEGAPRDQVLEAALWAAFGGHAAAAGRLVTVEGAVPGLLAALEQGAAELGGEIVAVAADDPRFAAPQGRVLAVVEVPDADTAVLLASRDGRDGPISIWARDPAKGERVARRLPSPATWVGHYGEERPNVEQRIARHVVSRQLEWRAPWAPRIRTRRRDPDGALGTPSRARVATLAGAPRAGQGGASGE